MILKPIRSPWEKQPCLFPSMQFPIMAKLGTKSLAQGLPTLPVLRVLFRCILLDVSSVFWLFCQSHLILINHPHRLTRKVVVDIQQIKSNAEGSSPLRIPACAIRIMVFTLRKDAKPFSSFPHNKFMFCSHKIGYTDAGELMGGKLRKSVLHVMWYTHLISSSCFRQVLWYSAAVLGYACQFLTKKLPQVTKVVVWYKSHTHCPT